jgi:hypothetical protein
MKKLLTIVILVLGVTFLSSAHIPYNHHAEASNTGCEHINNIQVDILDNQFRCLICDGITTLPGSIITGDIVWPCDHCGQWHWITFSGGHVTRIEVV